MKNKNKKDKRAIVSKGEKILLRLLKNPQTIDQKAYDKAQSFFNKGTRKKSIKHAKKFGYPGGLRCNVQSFQELDGMLFDATNGAYC